MIIAVVLLYIEISIEPVRIERPPIETTRPNLEIMTIGHRGASKFAPENTLPALEKAIELGVDYVEIDVRYTRDNVAILMHDGSVNRTTDGQGRLEKLSLEEIKALDAGGWFDPSFAGTRVPTLEEALQTAQGRICLFWDTKAFPQKDTIELFRKYGFDRDCLLISFDGLGYGGDEEAPNLILKYWPEAPLMPQVRDTDELNSILQEYPNIRAITIPFGKVTAELVDQAHAAGLLTESTTLVQYDHHHSYKKLIDAGIDIVMLDNVDSLNDFIRTGDLNTPAADVLPAYLLKERPWEKDGE